MPQSSNKSVKYKNYIAGWLDSSIHDFFEVFPPSFKSMECALVTCLDSNTDLASLLEKSSEFKTVMKTARPLGRGLLLPTKKLLELESRERVFFGFDEVWFFPREISEPKPESTGLVGPARVDQKTLNKVGTWMTAHSCSMAFGDGDGLNFILKAAGLVRHLLGLSYSQPMPALRGDFMLEEENSAQIQSIGK